MIASIRARLCHSACYEREWLLAQVPKRTKGEVCKTSRSKGSRKFDSYLVLNIFNINDVLVAQLERATVS